MHFSVAVIAGIMKPCIVVFLHTLFKQHHDPVPMTYISRSTDFVKIDAKSGTIVHFSVAVIAGIMKPCIVVFLHTLFKQHHDPVPMTYISRSTDFVKIDAKSGTIVHFSVAVIAGIMKPCIVVFLHTLFKQHHDPVPMTYISCSTDFVKILLCLELLCISLQQ